MKKCYIAGKIGDLPEETWRANFAQARQQVTDLGFIPVCPTCLPHNHDNSWQSCMREDLTALLTCDFLFAQRNYKQSKGALIEIGLAIRLGIPVIYQQDLLDTLPAANKPGAKPASLRPVPMNQQLAQPILNLFTIPALRLTVHAIHGLLMLKETLPAEATVASVRAAVSSLEKSGKLRRLPISETAPGGQRMNVYALPKPEPTHANTLIPVNQQSTI